MIYRVHFGDGTKVDVSAETALAARTAARARHPAGPEAGKKAIISKIKIVVAR